MNTPPPPPNVFLTKPTNCGQMSGGSGLGWWSATIVAFSISLCAVRGWQPHLSSRLMTNTRAPGHSYGFSIERGAVTCLRFNYNQVDVSWVFRPKLSPPPPLLVVVRVVGLFKAKAPTHSAFRFGVIKLKLNISTRVLEGLEAQGPNKL